MKKKNQRKLHTAYILRMSFALIGVMFILLFTARGIYQIIYALVNCSDDFAAVLSENGSTGHCLAIVAALKQSPGLAFDTIFFILSLFIFLHGVLGIYYAIFTKYSRLRENMLFYLQIFSAIAAVFFMIALLFPAGMVSTHSAGFWTISILIAGLASFHVGNGLYNASITLGISVSQRTKSVVKAVAWVVAAISFLQVVILFA